MPKSTHSLTACLISWILCSCENISKPSLSQTNKLQGDFVIPYDESTYEHFISSDEYPRTYSIYLDAELLQHLNRSNTSIEIDLKRQRGYLLYEDDWVVMDYPISSGQSDFQTPRGNFSILEKIRSNKRSNLYGKIYDAVGNLVKSDADVSKDAIPKGGKFVGASMKYWMRITWGGIGMHQGKVPRYPASHGCIRTYHKAVSKVYDHVDVGTPVLVR